VPKPKNEIQAQSEGRGGRHEIRTFPESCVTAKFCEDDIWAVADGSDSSAGTPLANLQLREYDSLGDAAHTSVIR
jgi:hypothetical protein